LTNFWSKAIISGSKKIQSRIFVPVFYANTETPTIFLTNRYNRSIFTRQSLTGDHLKIIGTNLFKIIETIYHNKENSMYLQELCQMLHREYEDVKVDLMYLSSLEHIQSDFIENTVNQRMAFLTPKSMRVMNRTMPPKNYDEFIQMFANPEKAFGDPVSSDKKSKFKRAFRFLKSD
jgi:hypothetical protein